MHIRSLHVILLVVYNLVRLQIVVDHVLKEELPAGKNRISNTNSLLNPTVQLPPRGTFVNMLPTLLWQPTLAQLREDAAVIAAANANQPKLQAALILTIGQNVLVDQSPEKERSMLTHRRLVSFSDLPNLRRFGCSRSARLVVRTPSRVLHC